MSFLSAIPIIGKAIDSIFGTLDKTIEDKDLKNKMKNEIRKIQLETENKLLEMNHEQTMGQVEIAKLEAKSNDAYVRRARPTILWICAAGMAYSWILHPLLVWAWAFMPVYIPELKGVNPPPNLSMMEMLPIIMGMLGLSGMRSFDKKNGKA
jgi:hypothetical protein